MEQAPHIDSPYEVGQYTYQVYEEVPVAPVVENTRHERDLREMQVKMDEIAYHLKRNTEDRFRLIQRFVICAVVLLCSISVSVLVHFLVR